MLRTMGRTARRRLSRSVSQAVSDPMAWNQAPAVITTLPNGVRVASRKGFGEVSSVGIFVDAGSRDETKDMAGASHLIQHLALTGTAKRPKAQLEKDVESIGATLDIDVGREQTSYAMSLMNGDVTKGVGILAELVTSPGITNLAKEKEGIIRALEETEKPTRAVIDDRLHACAYRDCSLGFSHIGPFDGIETLTADHLKAYVDSSYTADKIVLAASGAVEHDELVKQAASVLGGLKPSASPPAWEKPYFCGAELLYRNDEMGATAYIGVGWEGVPWRSPDAVTFMVMQSVIGAYKKDAGLVPGTISGNRTVNAVANKMGIGCAEEFECFNIHYKDTGMFGFYIACDEVAVEHALGELMFGMNLLSFAVTDEEVERAKRDLKIALFGGTNSNAAKCAELGQQVLAYGRGIPIAEMILRIDAIDAEEIKRVAYKYLHDNEVSATGLGPLHGFPSYMELRRSTYMHRY